MQAPSRSEVLQAQRRLLQIIAACVATLLIVHALPKAWKPWDPLRFVYTCAYFTALLAFCWALIGPLRVYQERLYAWAYEDAPPALERLWKLYLYSLHQVVGIAAGLAALFFAATALATLSRWVPGLAVLRFAYKPAWWCSLLALVLFPFLGGFLIQELVHRFRTLREQTALAGTFRPRTLAELHQAGGDANVPGLELLEGMAFRAGGLDWKWDDFYKGCMVFGQPGSGKTVCVLNSLLDGLLGSAHREGLAPSGLILDPKGDYCGKIRTLARRYGREQDLLILDPHRPEVSIRWNPLDSEDDELELAARFVAVMETLGAHSQETSFWLDAVRKFLRHAISLIRLTNAPGEPPDLAQVQDLANRFAAITERTDRLDVTDRRGEGCLAFFADEWAELAPQTRTSVQAHLTNMLDAFLMEPYATMFSGRSSCRISRMVDGGKILYVHMPIADKEAMARTVGTFVKLEYFREVLRRPDKPRPSFFFCDEFQVFLTAGEGKTDPEFFERSRQSNHANVIAAQNLPALYRRTIRRESVTNLLGNCALKVFLRNTDQETNEYASRLFGEHVVGMAGASSLGGRERFHSLGHAISTSDQYDAVVRPERFARLVVPSPHQASPHCESIVHCAARSDPAQTLRKLRWKVHQID